MSNPAADPIPVTVRVPADVRERVRAIWLDSHENPRLRPDPSKLLVEALRLGIESRRLAG